MNLVEESFKTKKVDKNKKIARIVLVIIIILIFAIIGIVAYIAYLDSTALKVSLNGKANQNIVQLLHFEDDGTIYVPIKRIASYFGYQSYNGEYSNRSEDASKCYVQGEKEIANFELNSNKIYKLDISSSSDNYEYFYTTKPVKAINGELCITTEGLQEAFNISFSYNRDTNRVQIYTMPYLISSWEKQVLNYGYNEISKDFVNQKAILASGGSMLIVRKGDYYGVIETKNFIFSIVDNVKQLFTGNVGIDQMTGPIGIGEMVSQTNGFREFIHLMALISISLGVTNLLPIPALDGGKILILIIEAIRRKPMKPENEINIQLLGFSILIALAIYVSYNDILRLL